MSEVSCPKGHDGDGYRLVRNGPVPTKTGRKQEYKCIAADGSTHRFRVAATDEPAKAKPTREVRCPVRGHKDATLQSRGPRVSATGTWWRYTCVRPKGTPHTFRVMVSEDGTTTAAAVSPPPPCREHPGSKVTRAATYGKLHKKRRPYARRQRYMCTPNEDQLDEDGNRCKPHQFTPAPSHPTHQRRDGLSGPEQAGGGGRHLPDALDAQDARERHGRPGPAAAGDDFGPVESEGPDPDEHVVRARDGVGDLPQGEHVGTSGAVRYPGAHDAAWCQARSRGICNWCGRFSGLSKGVPSTCFAPMNSSPACTYSRS